MDYANAAGKLLIALIIGAVIGLERESHNHRAGKPTVDDIPGTVGIRTFSLVAALGAVSGLIFSDYFPVFVFISSALAALLISYYILHSLLTKDPGFTTEIGLLYGFLIGLFVSLEIFPIQLTLAFSVILILILSRKSDIQLILRGIHREELHAFISYALIALAILPFLPNTGYSLSDFPQVEKIANLFNWNIKKIAEIEIINPFKLWFVVVAITGIDMLGYLFERVIGTKRGRLLASIVGGFISSTATTIALAQESKKIKKSVNYLVTSAIFANVASFFPLLILISLINGSFLMNAIPVFIGSILSGCAVGYYFFKKKDDSKTLSKAKEIKGIKESEIFAVVPALKFALLFLGVTIVTRSALELFGQAGFLITSSLAALTNMDAVTINTATLVGKTITLPTAVIAIILMNAVNLIGKSAYSYIQGNKEFAAKFTISAIAMISASLTGLLFI
jgi:uncharacterized membrane protein (DUF4010 family)